MNNLMIITYIYLFILFLMIIVNIKSRIYCVLGIGLIWVIMGGNNYNPDYTTYSYAYNNPDLSLFSNPGWEYMMNIGRTLGLDYNAFLCIIISISLILIIYSTLKVTKNYSIVLFMYMFVFMIIDTIQIRNFFSVSIVLFGLSHFINDKKLGITKYIVSILIASTLHITSLYFLIILFFDKRIFKLNKLFITSVLTLIFLFQIFPKFRGKLYFLFELFGKDYSNNFNVSFGYIYILIINLISYFVFQYMYKNKFSKIKSDSLKRFFCICYNLNLTSFVLIPFCMINMNVYRILRYLQFFNLILFSSIYKSSIDKKKLTLNRKELSLNIVIFINYLVWFYFIYFIYGEFDKIVTVVLKNNIFVK